ncbi:MAG: pilin [Candidatus Peregrinibacteria bacterium]|nr:pilin [Candidatus Peregrinibacteria bacterium]
MNFLKKATISGLLFIISILQFSGVVFAADNNGTVLPTTNNNVKDCRGIMNEVGKNSCWVKQKIFKVGAVNTDNTGGNTAITCPPSGLDPVIDAAVTANDILACGIKTGDIHLWMIPYYIRYILQFIIGISGLASVGGIVYGGYMYLFAGVSNDKDQGKKAIQYALIGLVMTLVAWAFVNIIISLVTG